MARDSSVYAELLNGPRNRLSESCHRMVNRDSNEARAALIEVFNEAMEVMATVVDKIKRMTYNTAEIKEIVP